MNKGGQQETDSHRGTSSAFPGHSGVSCVVLFSQASWYRPIIERTATFSDDSDGILSGKFGISDERQTMKDAERPVLRRSYQPAARTAQTYLIISTGFYIVNVVIGIAIFPLGTLDKYFGSYSIAYLLLTVLFFPFTIFRAISPFFMGSGNLTTFQVFTWLVLPSVSIGFTFWTWLTYRMAGSGSYTRTRSSSMLLGILGVFFGSMISGIFSLLAYAKLGELIQQPSEPTKGVVQPTVPSQKFCSRCGQGVILGMKFCTSCGTEVATTT